MLFSSGGKDSCYNMMQCVAAGHQLVALANLRPAHTGEEEKLLGFSCALQGLTGGTGSSSYTNAEQAKVFTSSIADMYVTLSVQCRIPDVKTGYKFT